MLACRLVDLCFVLFSAAYGYMLAPATSFPVPSNRQHVLLDSIACCTHDSWAVFQHDSERIALGHRIASLVGRLWDPPLVGLSKTRPGSSQAIMYAPMPAQPLVRIYGKRTLLPYAGSLMLTDCRDASCVMRICAEVSVV